MDLNLNLSPLALIFVFSTLNESIIEYLFVSLEKLRPYLPLLSLATATLLAFSYQVNVLSTVLGIESTSPFMDFLLSGFFISRGSNFINDFAQRVLRSK